MSSQPKILTIIPARGGSKGVPRKNIKLLNGKPLVYYAINAAKEGGVCSKIVVSTEDDEIATVAKSFGAEVVRRPEELAGDNVLTEPVMKHALKAVKDNGFIPDYISLIQCTSPFISSDIIKEAVAKVVGGDFDSCITVFMPDGYEFKWKKDENGLFSPEHDVENRPRRQDLNLPHHENGAFYITSVDLFEKTNSRFGGSGARVTAVEMSEEDSLQIDSPHHFWLAEQMFIYKKQQNDKQ